MASGLNTWTKRGLAVGFLILVVAYYTLSGDIAGLNEVIRIPVIDYLVIFLLYGLYLLINWMIDLFKHPAQVMSRYGLIMTGLLKDKVVVITGSSRGFGYVIAEAMLRAGAQVILSGHSAENLQKAVTSLSTLGTVKGQLCDVREESQVYALARFAVQAFGRIDVWINNAGRTSGAGWMLETPPRQAIDLFLTNDMGTLYGAQAALHFMFQRGEGILVNVYGNGSFLRPASPTGLYGATKAWITSFTRSLAKEIKGSGIKVIGFSPGMMLTDMLVNPEVIGEHGREMMQRYALGIALAGGRP